MAPIDALARFLRQEAKRSFNWRDAHCLMLVADWLVARGKPDPAAGHRTSADSEAAAKTLLANAGGLNRFARDAMARTGLAEAANPVCRGDVGLVTVLGLEGPVLAGGIWTGARWAVRGPRGLWIGRAQCHAAWLV